VGGLRRNAFPNPQWSLKVRVPPEWQSITAIAQAASKGDEDRAMKLLEEHLGYVPDIVLKLEMQHEWATASKWFMPKAENRFARARARLASKAMRDDRRETANMDSSWDHFPEMRRALGSYGRRLDEKRLDEIDRAIYVAKKMSAPDETLTSGKVKYRVKDDNAPSHTSVESPREYEPGKKPVILQFDAPMRSRSARDEKPLPLSEVIGDTEALHVTQGFDDIEAALHLSQLIEAAQLNDKELLTLQLHQQGFSHEEIASLLEDPSHNTVDQRMYRIRRKLRDAS
jgi:hypothetical protein